MIRRLIFIFVSIFATIACGHIDGYQGDTIGLSSTKHTFEAEGGDFSITTKGEFWGNGSVKDQSSGKLYYGEKVMEKELDGKEAPNMGNHQLYFNPHTIIVPDTIKGPWFWVARPELKKLVIHTDQNTSAQQRKFYIELPDCDYSGFIYITQKAAK